MNAWHYFSADWASRLGWTVLHSLWQGTLISILLAVVLALLRDRSAQLRYAAGLVAIAAVLASAVLTFRWAVDLPGQSPPNQQISSPDRAGNWAQTFPLIAPSGDSRSSGEQKPSKLSAPRGIAPSSSGLAPALPLVAAFWSAGVLLLSFWNLGGWIAAQRLRVLGIRAPDKSIATLAQTLVRRLRITTTVRIVVSLVAETPMVIGWLRPIVLLPAALLTGLTPKQIEGILAHELAHVRRHDYLINLFQVLAETLLFYHPAVWWMSRRVRLERERCCDEIAIALTEDRYSYAESLAALEEIRLGSRLALAARGSGGGQLLHRIKSILRRDDRAPFRAARLIVSTALLLLAAAIPISLLKADPAASVQSRPATQPQDHPTAPRLQFRLVADESDADTEEMKDLDSGQLLHVSRRVELDESDVKSARTAKTANGELTVDLDFTKGGSEKLAALTSANMNKKLAIVFDDRLLLAAMIKSKISNSLMLSGGSNGFTPQQAKRLAEVIGGHEPPTTAPAEPTTRHAAGFRADCVLSALSDGKRQILASPALNLDDGAETSFLFTGKPPVVIQELPSREAGILGTVSVEREPDGRLRVVCHISRRAPNGEGQAADDEAASVERSENLAALRLIDARLLLEAAGRELDFRHAKSGESTPYTPQEIARADPHLAQEHVQLATMEIHYQEIRGQYGTRYPGVLAAKERLELWRKQIDEDVKKFNDGFLIVSQPEGQPDRIVSKDLTKLQASVEECRRAYDKEAAMKKQARRAGGVSIDQTIKPGEPVAVELDDGTRLEVSVHPVAQ
jgi:beta-lactamase regulating signal transducer with metallopeptidase domain